MPATPCLAVHAAALVTFVALASCSDHASPTSPIGRASSGSANFAVVKSSFDVPVSFEGPLLGLSCVDPDDPPFAHVNAVDHLRSQTTSGGVTTTVSYFDIDRDNTWVIYKGVTYHVARGRPGKDDIVHTTTTPVGTYIETGLEPDFEVADNPSERLRLNFHWQMVIGKDGTTIVSKSTGACPLS